MVWANSIAPIHNLYLCSSFLGTRRIWGTASVLVYTHEQRQPRLVQVDSTIREELLVEASRLIYLQGASILRVYIKNGATLSSARSQSGQRRVKVNGLAKNI